MSARLCAVLGLNSALCRGWKAESRVAGVDGPSASGFTNVQSFLNLWNHLKPGNWGTWVAESVERLTQFVSSLISGS